MPRSFLQACVQGSEGPCSLRLKDCVKGAEEHTSGVETHGDFAGAVAGDKSPAYRFLSGALRRV
jgi:hypothetical protein